MAAAAAAAADADDVVVVGGSSNSAVVQAQTMAAGHLQKEEHEALLALRAAVTLESGLEYDEPPKQFFPSRHFLGAALLRHHALAVATATTGDGDGRQGGQELVQQAVEWAEDAVTVYEAALTEFPANGWAWTGLALAYAALPAGQAAHAAAAERYRQKAQEAWVRADVVLLDSATITLPAARLSPEAAAAAAADQQARGSALFGMSWGWWALFFTIVCGVWWWWLKKARMGGGGPSGGDMELLHKRERDGATISPPPRPCFPRSLSRYVCRSFARRSCSPCFYCVVGGNPVVRSEVAR